MTEQPPSARALIEPWIRPLGLDEIQVAMLAGEIDALIAQRVSAETERCAKIAEEAADYARVGPDLAIIPARTFASDLALDIRDAIRAQAERPAPERPHWRPGATAPKEHGVEIRIKIAHARGVPAYWDAELQTFVLSRPVNVESVREPLGWQPLVPSALASTGEQPDEWVLVPRSPTTEMLKAAYDDARANDNPLTALDCWDSMIETAPAPPSPAAVGDYTGRALQAARDAVESVPSELWIDRKNSETIAQAIAPDFAEFASAVASERDAALLAKLQEPDVREAVIDTLMKMGGWVSSFPGRLPLVAAGLADAALTKIAEMLK